MSETLPPAAPPDSSPDSSSDASSKARPPAFPEPQVVTSNRIGGVFKILGAAAISLLAIAAYVYFNEHPPVATGEVTHLSAYAVHRVAHPGAGEHGLMGIEQVYDQMIVIATVHLHNQSNGPLFVFDMFGDLSLPDQDLHALAASTSDFDRVFIGYPQLLPMKQHPLLRDATIPAGADLDGQLVFNFPITQEQWDKRKSLKITTQFTHQKDLVIQAPQ